MLPDVDEILNALFGRILFSVIPYVEDEYAARDASVLGVMLTLCAQEYDRAAHTRVEENNAMRALFKKAASRVENTVLAEELTKKASLQAESLKISDLNATSQSLQKTLIKLHAYIEEQSTPWAEEMDKEIFVFLREMAQGRVVSFQL